MEKSIIAYYHLSWKIPLCCYGGVSVSRGISHAVLNTSLLSFLGGLNLLFSYNVHGAIVFKDLIQPQDCNQLILSYLLGRCLIMKGDDSLLYYNRLFFPFHFSVDF